MTALLLFLAIFNVVLAVFNFKVTRTIWLAWFQVFAAVFAFFVFIVRLKTIGW